MGSKSIIQLIGGINSLVTNLFIAHLQNDDLAPNSIAVNILCKQFWLGKYIKDNFPNDKLYVGVIHLFKYADPSLRQVAAFSSFEL